LFHFLIKSTGLHNLRIQHNFDYGSETGVTKHTTVQLCQPFIVQHYSRKRSRGLLL